MGKNSCMVASSLESECVQGGFNVSALPSGSYYIGPNATQANPCDLSQIPAPTDIVVPPWAFLAIGSDENWNQTAAYENSTTALLATPTQSSTTTSATSTPSVSSSSHSNTGVIIGAAVASVVGFAILGFLIAFCVRRHVWRNSEERVDRYPLTGMVQSPSPSPFQQIYDTPATSVLYNPDDPNTFPKLGVPQDFFPPVSSQVA
ncbi:hypothetical protein SCLCIDRAFT_1224065 [Scleroderma citrinum Foug A]|uniref:Uncharacterized protein n=1 Tax=Scleroderma citrinum Foug A TaxID=1036808 RepID=A0A0C3D6W0_9AGAM|nr:hypothetical protein SCLCIDRAFT_1224065 [Scleroderma citrinum Foug A]